MEIKDFEQMTEDHIEICKKIIEKEGYCYHIDCFECPFFFGNYFKFEYEPLCEKNNESLVKSAKEFIELYNNKDIKVDEKATVENFEKESGIKYGLMLSLGEIEFIEDILNIFVGEDKGKEDLKNAESILKNIENLKNLTTFKRGVK